MANSVEIKHLSYSYGDSPALCDINLEIEKGKITGVIGADGAGKTTLLRLMVELLTPKSGEVKINAKDTAYMPQKFGLYEDLSIIENLRLYADIKNVSHDFDKLLEMTALKGFENRLAGKLSGGMKQKLGLICSLLGEPEFLVLDEPSVGVDPISRRELIKMVKTSANIGTTIVWSTAYLDEAYHFDKIILLHQGKVIFYGSPYELSPDTENFENKAIELMGGFKPQAFEVREIEKSDIEYPVEAIDLVKKFGEFYAVKNNSFQIKRGEIFGLLGPNGAGKTTSFKMMCGLMSLTGGQAKIMNVDMDKNPTKARSYLGYMAQKFSLYGDLTMKDNLEFFARVYGIKPHLQKQKIDKAVKLFNLESHLLSKTKELPLGIKQRLSFACAIMHNPGVLFLDEPTSGVDPISRREFWYQIKALANSGVTVLITTHFMDEAEFCDRISLFYNGEAIAVGTPSELKTLAGAKNMDEAFINLIEGKDEK